MIAPEFIPVWGGVGTYITELVRHLPKNMEIHVVTPARESFGADKVSSHNIDFSRYFGSNVHVHFISKASDTFFYNASFQFACLRYIPKLVKEFQIDVIHSHTAHMPDLLLMLRNLRKPTITTVHTTIKSQRMGTKFSQKGFSELEKSERATFLLYPSLRIAEELYFKVNRFYISPSFWMKTLLENNYNLSTNVEVIPNSIDLNDFKSEYYDFKGPFKEPIQQKFSDKKVILYVGRLLALKGVDTFIEAIPEILKNYKNKQLLFVFAGPGDRLRYWNKVKALKIESSCVFTGALPKNAVIQLMKRSKLLAAPSYIENAPYTILESMACGLPVIASNVGGNSEIVKEGYNGKLIEPNSPQSIANAIVNLLNDEPLRVSLGKHAKQTIAEKFSWNVNLQKYCDFYHSVIC